MASPTITLKAQLETILAGPLGGYLRITLCGFGPVLPAVPGSGMIADAGIPRLIGPQDISHVIMQQLWGNDVIVPAGTFYEVAVLDENENVIQCGQYQFTGSGTIDLSTAPQVIPPYGFALGGLTYSPCTGSGSTYVAPGKVIAVSYNGIFMVAGRAAPIFSYTLAADGKTISLNFTTSSGDRIDALCVQ